jgi:hypothetical protein
MKTLSQGVLDQAACAIALIALLLKIRRACVL